MRNIFIKPTTPDESLDQCQIFKDINFTAVEGNNRYKGIIITSVCDIVNPGKVDFYNFCPVLPYKELFYRILEDKYHIKQADFQSSTLGRDRQKEFFERIKNLLNNQIERHHWLGDIEDDGELWYIDYQLVQSVSFSKKDELLGKRIAKVESPLKESIFVRFSNYTGRVGLPGTNEEKLAEAEVIYNKYKSSS